MPFGNSSAPRSDADLVKGFGACYTAQDGPELDETEITYAVHSNGSGSGSNGSRSSGQTPQSAVLPPPPMDTDMTYTGLMTPNTQTILQQFLSMSPDQAEQGIESFQAAEASSEAMQAAWDPSNALIPTIPYEPAFMLPTGLNLLRPMAAYGADAEVDRFFSSMDEEAVAYHLGLPLNLSKQDLSISGPEPLPSTRDAASPPATDPSSWLPETEPRKRVKDVIDVPPFLRNKLLDSYFHNLQRCPCHCVDRDQLNRRLEGAENRPHPTWLFSMVSSLTVPGLSH